MKPARSALVALAATFSLTSPAALAVTYSKNNGVISYTANANNVPMISTLSVLGTLLMPYDNVGAGYQMTGRSSSTFYNPTQAGDCLQNASQTLAIDPNWPGNGIGIPSSNGFEFTVTPRNYQTGPTCTGGPLLPFTFEFAATLGDLTHIPKEAMLLEMAMTRLSGADQSDDLLGRDRTITDSRSLDLLLFLDGGVGELV